MTVVDRRNNSQGLRGVALKPAPEALAVQVQAHLEAIKNLAASRSIEIVMGDPAVAARLDKAARIVMGQLRQLHRLAYLRESQEPSRG